MPSAGWVKKTARRHGHWSGPSGHKTTKFETGRFVAWDGEGGCGEHRTCPPEGPCDHGQDYMYLANSEGGELVRPRGITTREAFAFLTSEARRIGPDATHVCFGLSYDANEMLCAVPRLDLRRLWRGDKILARPSFRVQYRSRKSLWVQDLRTRSALTVWDVHGFFQSTFIKAVVDNLGPADPRLPIIRAGKERRGTFHAAELDTIRPYTQAELSALVDLCVRLRASFDGAGLVLRRWDGAGAAAAALMEREGVKAHLAVVPPAVHDAALYAYSGGRIETLRYGYHEGTIWHGDIRSAYPFAAAEMPSLKAGAWHHTGKTVAGGFALMKVAWDFGRLGDRFPALPFSFRRSDHSIYFPRRGRSWVWRPEVEAALSVPDLARRVRVLDGWEFRPADAGYRPFAWIRDIYAEREKMKKAKPPNPAQKAIKLGLNSVYGKLAQKPRNGHAPPFHQIEYAGWITSTTRARLFRVAAASGAACVTLATDGIYATEPLPEIVDEDQLGGWELAQHEAMLIAQSGVYWLRDAPERDGRCDRCGGPVETGGPLGSVRCREATCGWSSLTEHYRGFDPDTLSPETVMEAWLMGYPTCYSESTRYVTLGRATLTETAFKKWRRWLTEERSLDVCAVGKREDRIPPGQWRGSVSPLAGLLPTDPADPHELDSTQYRIVLSDEAGEQSADAMEQVSVR